MAYFLVIDPGIKGFLALIDEKSNIIGSWPMPIDKNRKFCAIETWKLLKQIDDIAANEFEEIVCCLEGLLSLPSDTMKVTQLIKQIEENPSKQLFDDVYKELKKTDGRVGTKTMATNWGVLRGQIVALGWRNFTPSPRSWQAVIHKGQSGATAKIRGYNFCRSLWPDEDLSTGKRRGFNDNKTDSLCIAEYIRREFTK